MAETSGAVLHGLLLLLGLVATPDSGALGVTIALVALALLAFALRALPVAWGLDPSSPHPLRAVDDSAPMAQSDPDAAGHPRPRAPGHAALAA